MTEETITRSIPAVQGQVIPYQSVTIYPVKFSPIVKVLLDSINFTSLVMHMPLWRLTVHVSNRRADRPMSDDGRKGEDAAMSIHQQNTTFQPSIASGGCLCR